MGDYDRKPMEPASQFLRLKSKGETVRVRIAGSPYRELKVWPGEAGAPPLKADVVAGFTSGQWASIMRNPDFTINEVFHFAVIDRGDTAAKIFTTTGGVYGKIRKFATDAEWGDPKNYDLTIVRTEQPGKNYYEVTPSPNKSDLTLADLSKVDALKMAEKLPNAVPASAPQPDDIDANTNPEPLPWETGAPAAAPAPSQPTPAAPAPRPDTVNEDVGDEPININDIPF